jgi:uncharacterized membrane protein
MREDSPWEDVWCEFCGERIHYSKIDEHERMVHSLELEADAILNKLSWREGKGIVEYAVVILAITAILGVLEWIFKFDYPWWYGYLMVGLVISIVPALIIIHFRAPAEEKERMQRAWETMRACNVKCEICEQKVAWGDYWSHLKSFHPSQVPYEWFRAFSLVVFIADLLGGMLAIFVLASSGAYSTETMAFFIGLWVASVAVFIVWASYMSQIGERKHIKKMQERWQQHRFALRETGKD